jgi:hypothetical protein
MKQEGLDWGNAEVRSEYTYAKMLRMARRIRDEATAIRPGLLLYFNGIPFEDQQDLGTYIEFECLPTGGWGYDALPLYARDARNLGKPVLNMTGRFHRSWGDFGGIRTRASLEYDCLYGIANAMRTTIGDHFHPRGDTNEAVFAMVRDLYPRLQRFEPWLEHARAETEIGVLQPPPGFRNVDVPACTQAINILKGTARVLCELNMQFDVLPVNSDRQDYPVLVLPDETVLDEGTAAKVQRHLDEGGRILATGWWGLDRERQAFVLGEPWGVSFEGDEPCDPAFFRAAPEIAGELPDMPLNFYSHGTAVKALPGTQVLAEIVAPFYNRHWDGEHGFVYLPPDRAAGRPAVTLTDRVAYISHAVFGAYHECAPVPNRTLVRLLLSRLLPCPLVQVRGLPSFGRVTVTSQPGRRMVHLLAYCPERRGAGMDMIEEPIELRGVSVKLRLDGHTPRRVYRAPDEEALAFSISDDAAETAVPAFAGYAMIVFDET